jgi:hypothetical protein
LTWFSGFYQADGAEHRCEGCGLGRGRESSVFDESGEQTLNVVARGFESVEGLDEEEGDAEKRILGASEVGDVKLASGAEDASHFLKRTKLLLASQVVKDEARENMIEGGVGKG